MATAQDVCRLAGVSTATLSRTLRTPELVKEDTRNKVFSAIEKTGYRPNLLASSVKTGKSHTIMVLVPNLINPFFLRLIHGIEDAAQEHSYSVLLCNTQGESARENEYAAMTLSNRADGIIHLDHSFPFSDSDKKLAEKVPMVSIGERIRSDYDYPVIELDNFAATRALALHLVSYGHTQFGLIAGKKNTRITDDRIEGILSVMRQEGIELDDARIVGGAYTTESGRQGAIDLMQLENPPTAIFCLSDDIAIGAIYQLKEMGIRVPEDVSVVGFDNIAYSAFIDPPLTTIDQPAHEMGVRAVQVLMNQIKGKPLKRQREVLPFLDLLERKSSGPVSDSDADSD